MRIVNRLVRADNASITTEFALVLPLVLIFTVGLVDAGRLMWTWNRAEKATQMGVRFAATTDMVSTGLASHDFYSEGIPRGDPIPQSSFGGATCTSTGCTCAAGEACPDVGAIQATAFNNTLARMQAFMAEVRAENVTIEYGYSGLGYSGDPYGPDINPLITIRLGAPTAMQFRPYLASLFGNAAISLPPFAATLTMEDGTGTIAN